MFERIKQFFNGSRVKSKSLKRILAITEDNSESIKFFNRTFKKTDWDLLTAVDKISGLEMAKKYQPDMIILNAYLYEKKSIDVCLGLKENDLTKHIPVLVIAEKDDHSNMVEYYAQGIDLRGYLIKPISSGQIIKEINLILKHAKDKEC